MTLEPSELTLSLVPFARQTAAWSLAYGYEKKDKAAKVLPGASLDLTDAFAVGGTVTAAAVRRPLPTTLSSEACAPCADASRTSLSVCRVSRPSSATSSSCTLSSTRASPRRSSRSGSRRPSSARSRSSSLAPSSPRPSSRRPRAVSSLPLGSRSRSSTRSSSRRARTSGTASRRPSSPT